MPGTDVRVDLTGQRFGRLVALRRVPPPRHYAQPATFWEFRCDCGAVKAIRGTHVQRGLVVSCGCSKIERIRYLNHKHGMTRTAEYVTWKNMRRRCDSPAATDYHNYGGRGITVCDEWADFPAFYQDMGDRPSPAHSIERRNNDGPYSPENCYWATNREQTLNTRRNVRFAYRGCVLSAAEAAQRTGISERTITLRLRRGWTPEEVMNIPLGQRRKRKG